MLVTALPSSRGAPPATLLLVLLQETPLCVTLRATLRAMLRNRLTLSTPRP